MSSRGEIVTRGDADEPRLVHLVGTAALDSGTRTGKPVIVREIVEEPDGWRHVREVEFPQGW